MKVPDGWTIESVWDSAPFAGRFLTIAGPTSLHGMATLDLEQRGFRLGVAASGRMEPTTTKYRGRGWKQALCDAAVARLQEIAAAERKEEP